MQIFAFESGVMLLVVIGLLVVKLWALVDALTRPAQAYSAADKLTKPAWLWMVGLSFAFQVILPTPYGLFSLAGDVASFVYLLDVRPALAALTRRR